VTPVEGLRHALRIIEAQRAELEVLRYLLEARRAEDNPWPRNRPRRVRFCPSPTFLAHSPEFRERATEAARRRQARDGIGP